jgi:hypothetical protein
MTRQRGELGGSRVCACAARPCARACRRCQRQRRVEHPITALGGAAAQRQRVVRREMQGRAYLAGHPTLVTTDIEHACICEEFTR